ncbi:hypothetical protein BSK50_14880 [Paenibacillus odorifer]|nr:hypothetical protein BSK50_14880 [Paenibacillus odorifer]
MLSRMGGDRMPNQSPQLNTGSFDITDLFGNTSHNWDTIGPALWVLFGVMFGAWVVRKIIKRTKGDD